MQTIELVGYCFVLRIASRCNTDPSQQACDLTSFRVPFSLCNNYHFLVQKIFCNRLCAGKIMAWNAKD